MLKRTECATMARLSLSICPVAAEPVNATASCSATCDNRSPALPHTSCTAPAGRMLASMMERNTASVRKLVAVAGFTMHGMPASSAGASFSIIPHTGKLNALM